MNLALWVRLVLLTTTGGLAGGLIGSCGSEQDERIVFQSARPSGWNIFVMQPDGTIESRLSKGGYVHWSPAMSPDGSRIAYSSNVQGPSNIFVMDADGSNAIQLTNSRCDDWWPSWGPKHARQSVEVVGN